MEAATRLPPEQHTKALYPNLHAEQRRQKPRSAAHTHESDPSNPNASTTRRHSTTATTTVGPRASSRSAPSTVPMAGSSSSPLRRAVSCKSIGNSNSERSNSDLNGIIPRLTTRRTAGSRSATGWAEHRRVATSGFDAGTATARPRSTTITSNNNTSGGTARGKSPDLGMLGDSKEERPEVDTLERPASRQVAIRGVLPLATGDAMDTSPRVPASTSGMLEPLVASTTPRANLQDLVLNARPRTRYARRENSRQSARVLERIATTPSLPTTSSTISPSRQLQHSQSDVGVGRSAAIGSDTHRHNHDDLDTETELPACNRIISWGEDDISSFFLTEIDGKAAADQWQLASLIARGSYFLYAAAEFKHAVLCFSDALALTQVDLGTPNDPVALQALLNHHIGEAFKEEGLAKWALMMQKKALQLAQQAQDTKIAGRAHKAIGVLCLDMHQFDKARKYQQRALDAAIQTKDIDLEARVYANLGNIASAQGEFGHAIASHERDLKLSSSKALRSALGMARAHRNLALVYEKLGRRELHAHHDAQASVTGLAHPPFLLDLQQHSRSAVGNVYLQLTYPNTKLADMVATSVQDLLRELATRGHVMLPQSSMPTASAQNPMQFDQVAQSNAY